jgi:tRNA1Val (adenine37-N6)-methyltransferase
LGYNRLNAKDTIQRRKPMIKENERIDDLDLNGLKIIQNPEWFCFGVDAVLLSDFARVKKKDKAVDLGTGTGIIPILLYGKYNPENIIGVEIQEEVAEMASRSVLLNELQDKITIHTGDIKDCFKDIGTDKFDVVTSNPPYKKGDTGLLNPEDKKAISRHELLITLDELIFSASKLLKVGGRFYMIHRPERLADIILGLNKNKFSPKRIRFVHPYLGKKPTMVLVEATKCGGNFLLVEEPLYIYKEDGSYTDEILRIYGRC